MAAFNRKLGEQNAGTGTAVNLTALAITAGEFVVIWVACDNTGTATPTVSDVTWNAVPQTFTVVASHNSSTATSASGTRGFIIIVPSISTTLASHILAVSLSASVSKSVMIAAVFDGVTSTVAQAAVSGTSTSGVPSCVFAAPPALGSLALAEYDGEDNTATLSINGDTNGGGAWVDPAGDGKVFTTGGGTAANVAMHAVYKIISSTAIATGVNTTGISTDSGCCQVALTAAVVVTYPARIRIAGAAAAEHAAARRARVW